MSGMKIPKPSLQMYIYMQRSLTVCESFDSEDDKYFVGLFYFHIQKR